MVKSPERLKRTTPGLNEPAQGIWRSNLSQKLLPAHRGAKLHRTSNSVHSHYYITLLYCVIKVDFLRNLNI